MGSMSIVVKDHGKQLCEKLQSLRSDTNLVDLDLVCEDEKICVHKVVMVSAIYNFYGIFRLLKIVYLLTGCLKQVFQGTSLQTIKCPCSCDTEIGGFPFETEKGSRPFHR